ncbi:autotransporter outer membrane beta-barrel domain-containing protein [Escherichia coli]|nr:autotransporter outer membrane beta-barrel domain-containing protein [Escherichia coli]EGL8683606.1 autotransporter outer membrane beta-barrel domain-containing protein [Escherichia coli]EIP9486602.1 autotransporter outer membrane beta-barrel domain-containing protein [Escherichia coli]EJC8065933.1 autotransporter outer membrane beta-barrel domain-containing protein [Escherichia coli]
MNIKKSPLSVIISSLLFSPLTSAALVTSVTANQNQSIVMSDDVLNSNNDSNAVYANGQNATIDTNGHTITTSGNRSSAANAANGGVVNVNGGAIDVHGASSRAVSAEAGGIVNVNGTQILVDGINSNGVFANGGDIYLKQTTITTTNEKSYAIASESTQSGYTGISDSQIITSGKNSHGINASQGNFTVSDSDIKTTGNNARGISISNKAVIDLNNVSITTSGGERADGLVVGGVLKGQNLAVLAEGSNSYAAVMADTGVLDLQGSSLVSKQYAALDFTNQGNSRTGAIATFGDSSLHGNTAAILATNSVGQIDMINSTARSDMGILANIGSNAEITVDASQKSVLSGTTSVVTGSTLNILLSDGASWISGGDSTVTNLLLDNGNLVISGPDATKNVGNVVTVTGDYRGNNGNIEFNTVLAGDDSTTDKLIVQGNTSGKTFVTVNKAGGSGAQTLNGIELIHVDGQSDGEFTQTGRIAAGAYEYKLGRGTGTNSGNWYLTSGKNTPDPLPNPEPTPTPTPDSKPEPAPGGYDNDLRPEAGSYTANMAAANTMFVTRLHERLGPVQYTDVMTGETKNTSMWMRHEGGHNRWRDGTGQLKTQGNRYVVQLGGDIAQWGWGETDRWHLGVMAGYGNDHNNTDSVRTGYRSKGSVNGYSTGLYATWFANDETHNGAYLDTWAQYGWFDNHVKGDGLPGESWKSKGLTASLETGYTWKAGEFSGSHGSLNEWYVQPQAQVVWMGVKADEHRESNGTRVESTGDGNVRTRLGVKTWIKGHNRMDDGKSREFRPFVEVNWLHNTRDFGTRMNGVTVHQDGARNIGEVKAGVEGQINDRLNLWGNVGVQAGDKGYSDTSAMLGVKYTF